MATVIAPVAGYTGTVGRVRFLDGAGHTDDIKALRYFQRAGYTITDNGHTSARASKEPVTTEDATPTDNAPETGAQAGDRIELAAVPVEYTESVESSIALAPTRPRPSASKAEWFEYLEAVHPGHGLTVEHTKAEIIAAVGED